MQEILEEIRPVWRDDHRLIAQAKPFREWRDHIAHALHHVSLDGLYCEFGVYTGGTLNHLCAVTNPKIVFHAFDWFRGLPEDWLPGQPAGHLNLNGKLPKYREERVVIHNGLFEDTLPGFVAEHPGPLAFAHIDCDLYSSTKTIFKHLRDRIVPGTVLVFDEYITGIDDERKALLETEVPFNYLSRHHEGGSVAVQIT